MKKSVEVGGGAVLLVLLAGIVNNMGADEARTATPVLTTSTASTQSTTTVMPSTSTATEPSSSPTSIPTIAGSVAAATKAPVPMPTVRTYKVTKVVDGDTIVVSGGARVRLIGIDAPEANQCGATTATRLLSSYVLGKSVTLTAGAQTDKDRYGRLLRYVNVGSFDPGLKLIQVGRAIARYDSRDGYGAHPREAVYVRADAASPNANICSTPKPAPVPLKSVYYENCAAARAAGAAPLYVGEPGYRLGLDRDHDGVACEN